MENKQKITEDAQAQQDANAAMVHSSMGAAGINMDSPVTVQPDIQGEPPVVATGYDQNAIYVATAAGEVMLQQEIEQQLELELQLQQQREMEMIARQMELEQQNANLLNNQPNMTAPSPSSSSS